MTASRMSGALNYFTDTFSKRTREALYKEQGICLYLIAPRVDAKRGQLGKKNNLRGRRSTQTPTGTIYQAGSFLRGRTSWW